MNIEFEKIVIRCKSARLEQKHLIIVISVFLLFSCISSAFPIFRKSDYFLKDGEKHIRVQYNSKRELYDKSPYYLTIKNLHNEDIYLFSTVLENRAMLYSKSNYSKDRKALKLNSYYENYMKDAVHSGIRKFNLI